MWKWIGKTGVKIQFPHETTIQVQTSEYQWVKWQNTTVPIYFEVELSNFQSAYEAEQFGSATDRLFRNDKRYFISFKDGEYIEIPSDAVRLSVIGEHGEAIPILCYHPEQLNGITLEDGLQFKSRKVYEVNTCV